MLLITNNCMGGFLYRELKHEYNHPFFWGTTGLDMLKLVTDFDNINFDNITLEKYGNCKFKIIIDNKIEYKCLHYIFSPNDKVPRVEIPNVYYNKIWEYIVEKYTARLKRMKESKETPSFAIHWAACDGFNKTNFEEFIQNDFKYKTVVFIPYEDYKDFKKDNLILVYDPISDKPQGNQILPYKYKDLLVKV